jgi:ABC-type branched-subunit amino acid transport system ATPase component
MIKFIIGPKGSGKTRTVLNLANRALEDSKGEIVFINGSDRRMLELDYQIRCVNTREFGIQKLDEFYGFISGIIARNYDTDQIYIDGLFDASKGEPDEVKRFLLDIKKLSDKFNIKFYITMNGNPDNVPAYLQEYIA